METDTLLDTAESAEQAYDIAWDYAALVRYMCPDHLVMLRTCNGMFQIYLVEAD